MKKVVLFVSLFFLTFAIIAQEQPENESGIKNSDELVLQITTLPEAKLTYAHHFNFPFLQGDNPLVSGNNIDLALLGEVTPISLEGIANVVWTPIAFFELSVGGKIGSGWNINLFGSDLNGIGFNSDDGSGNSKHSGSAFDGFHWRAQAGAALQMDMAALIPGDWNHVLMRTYHEFNYRGYSAAKAGESWVYQADAGENQNGFNYYGNLQLAYQMPLSPVLNLVAVQAEADLYLYDTPNLTQWGEEKVRWTLSGVLNFALTDNLSAALIAQIRTRRNYMEGVEGDKDLKAIYYRNRHIDTSDPIRLQFFRIALGLTYNF